MGSELTAVSGGAVAEMRQFFEDYGEGAQLVEIPHPLGAAKGVALITPKGLQVTSAKAFLDEYRTRPERRKGRANVTALASLIELTNRFKDDHSALFAIEVHRHGGSELVAVLNYHERGPENPAVANEVKARFSDHLVAYACPLSDEWMAWTGQDAKPMEQGAFAAFLEDRIMDLAAYSELSETALIEVVGRLKAVPADPARILELAAGIEIHQSENILQSVKLASGETRLTFQTEHKNPSGQPLEVPAYFGIKIPIFRFGTAVPILVRLRYRITDGRINWYFQLYRPQETRQKAFVALCSSAAEQTGLPLYFGIAEGLAA